MVSELITHVIRVRLVVYYVMVFVVYVNFVLKVTIFKTVDVCHLKITVLIQQVMAFVICVKLRYKILNKLKWPDENYIPYNNKTINSEESQDAFVEEEEIT